MTARLKKDKAQDAMVARFVRRAKMTTRPLNDNPKPSVQAHKQ